MAKPDFRAAASQRLAQEEKLSDSVLSLLKPEGEQHERAVRQIAVDRISPNPKQPRTLPNMACVSKTRLNSIGKYQWTRMTCGKITERHGLFPRPPSGAECMCWCTLYEVIA